jgi:serine/threonine protein kinase/energy-coupling factor transporter ATP-binding protein EcfA2
LINSNNHDSRMNLSGSYLGNYRLIRLLGHGGFAAVFLGEHRYLQRPAAIKVLRTVLADEEKEHFLAEARLLANLSHPHIVRVLEFAIAPRRTFLQNRVVIENIPFLVMDYMPGGSLRTVYPIGTRLFLETVTSNIKQAAEALYYAHTQRIIHRDIKPENLLLNERQEVMLSDFGLALFAPQPGSLSRQDTAGTLPYTAPEQLRGKPVFASDQYSLGIVAYEWLCGHPPFRGEDAEIIMQHISSPPPSLRSMNSSLSPAVEEVILRALAKDPAQRYDTIRTFAASLEHAAHMPKLYPGIDTLPTPKTHPQLPNVFPFFYYFSQKPVATTIEPVNQTTIIYPPPARQKLQSHSTILMTPSKQRNRLRMLQKVRIFWVEDVLEPSLHDMPFITPEFHTKDDAVANPWEATFHQTQKHGKILAPTTSITEIYDQSGGELLILGEAGSGKTTLLLQLTRILLDRAEHDDSAPIPVVFLLSTWNEKQLPIDQWLVEELNKKYQVPRVLGEMWLHSEAILPLLDGLDEVAANVRSACIVAINSYKQQNGLSPLVVCSRLTEYLLFPPRVLLQRAIVVQPLTTEQITNYLLGAGEKYHTLYQILREDVLLQRLVTTPLMLNITMIAYQDKSLTDLLAMRSPKERYEKILATYVEQMLYHHPITNPAMAQQLTDRLAYLAKKMQQQDQTVFYIELMQPTWIDKNNWLQVYMWLAVLLPGALIGAIGGILTNVLLFHAGSIGTVSIDAVFGAVMGYLLSTKKTASLFTTEPLPRQGNRPSPQKPAPLINALFVGLITLLCIGTAKGWAAGLANALFLSVFSIPIYQFIRSKNTREARPTKPKHPPTHFISRIFPYEHFKDGIPLGHICGLTSVITLIVNHSVPANGFVFLLTLFIRDSLRNTLLGVLLSLLLANHDGIIHCTEVVSWSWRRFSRSLFSKDIFYNALLGVMIGIIFSTKQLFQGNVNNILSAGLSTGILIMLGIRLVSAILQGISSNKITNQQRTTPNEGIHRSLSHGLVSFFVGSVMIAFFTIITGLLAFVLNGGLPALTNISGLLVAFNSNLANALLLAPIGGLFAALSLGWLAAWQHTLLRIILRINNALPLQISRFLDYATDCALLRRTGGGYIFIHRAFLEYFAAACEDEQIDNSQQAAPEKPEPLVRLL